MRTEERGNFYKTLDSEEFEQLMRESNNAVVLDVRTENEFNSQRIPNSININIMGNSFARAIAELDKTKVYLVYCLSGGRSAAACSMMAAQGFEVYNLGGGITYWTGEVC